VSGEIPSGDPIVHGRDLPRGFDEGCDAVVIGSGAGGAVVAAQLAEAGRRVIVLEEGPYFSADEYRGWKVSESVRRLFREAGMLTAFGVGETPIITITLGRAVGGSSVLTGGVCFRIPGEVHHRWAHDLGLDELGERALEAAYEDVERRLEVREVPAVMRSEASRCGRSSATPATTARATRAATSPAPPAPSDRSTSRTSRARRRGAPAWSPTRSCAA
jgi:choline dehydrogenase-like flavoprotein